MRRLRRSWLALPLLSMLWVLPSGCTQQPNGAGNGSSSSNATSANGGALRVAMVTDKGGLGDQSFNDSAHHGLEQAEKELGITQTVVQSKEEGDYKKNLTTVSDGNFDLVVAVGTMMKSALQEVAAKFPRVKYAIVDGDVEGLDNVTSLTFKEEEGSFLAGALAGLMTKSNKIGFIGGMEIPLIVKFESGYHAGLQTVNAKADFLQGYTNKWDDPGKGKEMAESQFNQGADIIFSAAGACGKGVIEAAKGKGPGFWAIGVDSDQDFLGTADPKNPAPPGRVLTSMVKHVDTEVYNCVKDLKAGQFHSGKQVFGLKEGGVGLSDMKYTRDQIPAGVLQQVDALKAEIVAGQIQVPYTAEQLKDFKPPVVPSGAGTPAHSAPADTNNSQVMPSTAASSLPGNTSAAPSSSAAAGSSPSASTSSVH